ncbi:hypothetical protein B0A58_01405 [Flavobacterium branchiophilum NBRC 15030 = ATCC 35035]|uniref:Outer membrane protein X n=1 Tax=Flavobacterium branchiophilum TaxID=55197 RepID=A0A543G699_9FLAO|nr:outer membrane beta-barrel protein [Flavobacterium branchiophilum]OXA81581.1 hypothetical protein B0A58_01405 [Flavobacterium branchiophilum NBRC 15030 = ATCC 35035]TQM41613.1 outer membrane protein X [Flavobacterium branchiophilum]
MKKFFIATAIMLASLANAQSQGGFRVGLDLGYALPAKGGGGFLVSIEPKYNIKDNMNIGLRFGAAAMAKNIQSTTSTTANVDAEIGVNNSYLLTYDYYFNQSGSSFVPYIGAGAGLFQLANLEINDTNSTTTTTTMLDATSKTGGLVRGGFEWGKFRMGVEYNFVPKSNIQDLKGTVVGSTDNSYLGIHLGFYIGGGKWGN